MNLGVDESRQKGPWVRAWDAAVDAHPVLAKELLVTARTPVYVGSVVAAPLLLSALVLLVRWGMGHTLEYVAGPRLFHVYFTGLALVLGFLGGALGSTVVVQERETGALEALKFSSLSPGGVVLGKFAAVVLAEVTVAACTLPLLDFLWCHGGVSLGETFVGMAIALACGVMTAGVGVGVSAHVAHTRRSLLVSLAGSSVIGIVVAIWMAVGSDLPPFSLVRRAHDGPFGVAAAYFEAPFDGGYVALLCVVPAYLVTIVLWLGYAVAKSGLMDLSEDRGLPIKHWTVGALSTGMVMLAMCGHLVPQRERGLIAGTSMTATAILAAVLLFAFAGEPLRPTRRMRAQPRSALAGVFFPRCLAPSILFALVTSGIVLLSVPVLCGASPADELHALWVVAFLSALGGFMGSIAAYRGGARARIFGAMALFCFIFSVVLLRADSGRLSWVDVVCPLWLVPDDGVAVRQLQAVSFVAWAAAACMSVGFMLGTVRTRRATA